jgi:hypothetical protein
MVDPQRAQNPRNLPGDIELGDVSLGHDIGITFECHEG